jgi:hypothetical protein
MTTSKAIPESGRWLPASVLIFLALTLFFVGLPRHFSISETGLHFSALADEAH